MNTLSSTPAASVFTRKARHIYGDQLLCLLVLLLMATLRSGTRSLGLAVFSVITAVLIDMLCCAMTRKIYNPRDLSTITSGLCLALMSPAAIPYSLVVFGSGLAIGVKHIFGGKDNYIFNPTAVALAFLIICFPARMLLFPGIDENVPLMGENLPLFREVIFSRVNGFEHLLLSRSEFPALSALDFWLGNFAGPVGTTHVLVIAVSAVCLLLRRSISPVVTISCISVVTIFRLLFPIYDDVIGALVRELFGGYLFFALIFLANDPQTIPKTAFGKLYYGVILGIFTIIFRGGGELFQGRVEGWFIFAILASNTFSGRMDIIAGRVSDSFVDFGRYMRERLSAYERFSDNAKSGREPFIGDLTATMEIDLDPSNYDMPPIDNKVIKIKRKRRNLLTVMIELMGSLKDKGKGDVQQGIPDSFTDASEHKTPLVLLAFRALGESIKGLFRKPAESPAPYINKSDVYSEDETDTEIESGTGVRISDFEEIADDIAKIEAELSLEQEPVITVEEILETQKFIETDQEETDNEEML